MVGTSVAWSGNVELELGRTLFTRQLWDGASCHACIALSICLYRVKQGASVQHGAGQHAHVVCMMHRLLSWILLQVTLGRYVGNNDDAGHFGNLSDLAS